MNTLQLLEALAKKHGLANDYQIAKYLGVSTGRISNYRVRGTTLDELMACRLADELELERGQVLAWMAAERAEKQELPEVAKAWQRVARRAVGVMAAIGVGISAAPSSAPCSSGAQGSVESLCIMVNRRRWLAYLEAALGAARRFALTF